MNSLMKSMNASLSFTEEERSTISLPDRVHSISSSRPGHTLLVRVLIEKTVYKLAFYDQMSGHWKRRFPVTITKYKGDMFHIVFDCAGDKARVLNKEP
ncbi:hypothetical protein CsatB_018592 [Cannabis sativa]